MSPLRFAPWINAAPENVPVRDHPPAPGWIPPEIGQVVVVEEMRSNQRTLAVIEAIAVFNGTRWYSVTTKGATRWVHACLITQWEPPCARCGARRWWWTTRGDIRCGTCHVPTPDWVEAWRMVAALTIGLTCDDHRTKTMLALLEEADQAFLTHDWPTFQRTMVRLRVISATRVRPQ